MHRLFRTIVMICALVTAVGGATVAAAGSASASTIIPECNVWGPIVTIKGIGVHQGTACGNVTGSGDYVISVTNGFTSLVPVCNWNITAEFFRDLPNGDGNVWTHTINGTVHHSCSVHASDGMWVDAQEQTGFVCSTLKENGARLTSWCASIHP